VPARCTFEGEAAVAGSQGLDIVERAAERVAAAVDDGEPEGGVDTVLGEPAFERLSLGMPFQLLVTPGRSSFVIPMTDGDEET
jgi:hypothetical protein